MNTRATRVYLFLLLASMSAIYLVQEVESTNLEKMKVSENSGQIPPPIDCTDKCEGCRPCTPILIPVFPVKSVWFCQCGGKLYLPPPA
ncbi:hypothetical protein Lser_V15G26912 [Lactuca serriola]